MFAQFQQKMAVLPQQKYLIALSGGLDSCVLLHLVLRLKSVSPIQIRVIHINHQISPNADTWQQFCAKLCENSDVKFFAEKIQLDLSANKSLEAEARRLRYQIFAEYLQEDEILLTAHTKTDQAETLLLQLFRGAGPKGLSAMPWQKTFAKNLHARPLLEFSREELQSYAENEKVQWIEDESNIDVRFDRNFLRHDIFPLLKKRWPAVFDNLARAASHFSEASSINDQMANHDLLPALTDKPNILKIEPLLILSIERQKNALRHWVHLNRVRTPDSARLQQIIVNVLYAAEDRNPLVTWDDVELRRFQDRLYLLPKMVEWDNSCIISWDFSKPLLLPGNIGTLVVEQGSGLRADLDRSKITVRFRQGGEAILLNGCRHELKKLLQEWKVPPWQRDKIPLIFFENRLIAVVGFSVSDEFFVGESGLGIKIKN